MRFALLLALLAAATSCEPNQYYNPEVCSLHVIGWCGPDQYCELQPLGGGCFIDENGKPKHCSGRCIEAAKDERPCSKVSQRWPGECEEAKAFVADAGAKD